MSDNDVDPLWYKDAVIYELYVRSFQDGNNDGIGDFRGLTQRLDYLSKLGVTAIWLLPFYPSPMRDGGYDISDYTSVHPDFGTMADFRRFTRAAHELGMKVITELVINHTSDQHPWFQRARRAPKGSSLRDMYVWSDTDTRYAGTRIIFTDTETSNWAWDPVAGQYYWHRFFSHQPDLNFQSPRVMAAVKRFMKFWFDAGVDGMRLDAIPYLCEREGTNNENLPETHGVLKELRRFVDEHYEGRMLLAEANQWPSEVRDYFGDNGDECQMAFHFPVMPRMFMSLRQEDRHPMVDILVQTPEIPESCQWGLFLRNHDELTLEMVSDEERDYMYSAYATDTRMRVNVGIRRRLAPLLGNNRRATELLNSLLFSLPGTPILYYGDEIAMGDNIFLGDRDGVRTPMQWTGDRNAGFSQADPARLYLPPIMDPLYGYQGVNVEAQERSPSSLLNWMRRMIALRRSRQVFGRGSMEMLHPANRHVLAFVRRYREESVLVVANLSRFVQPVELDLSEFQGMVPVEMLGRTAFPAVTDGPYMLALGPHTFYWFDLTPAPEPAVLSAGTPAEPEWAALEVRGEWSEVFAGAALQRLETEALPAFVSAQRWFGGKGKPLEAVRVIDVAPLLGGPSPAWWVLLEASYAATDGGDGSASGEREVYSLPLAVATGRAARRIESSAPASMLAFVRGPRGTGIVHDATASDAASLAIIEAIGGGAAVQGRHGRLRMVRERPFRELYDALDETPNITRPSGEQSNTSLRLGGQLQLKLIRRIEAGAHPELEVGRHLMAARFERYPRLAGAVEYAGPDQEPAALAILQEFAWSQGDGWTFSLGEIRRYLEEAEAETDLVAAPDAAREAAVQEGGIDKMYQEATRVLGVRSAEMHLALGNAAGDPAFEPEPMTPEDLALVGRRIEERLRTLGNTLRQRFDTLPEDSGADAELVIAGLDGRRERLDAALAAPVEGQRIRVHGDYHLGQVLWAMNDWTIIDFEGEVGLPLEARRGKQSPLADVAGMLRSFSYAASVGLREHLDMLPDRPAALERLTRSAQLWEQVAAASFLSGYLDTVGDAGLVPSDAGEFRRRLDLFTLDKALHELEYELGHRPDWIHIPLHAVAALLRALD